MFHVCLFACTVSFLARGIESSHVIWSQMSQTSASCYQLASAKRPCYKQCILFTSDANTCFAHEVFTAKLQHYSCDSLCLRVRLPVKISHPVLCLTVSAPLFNLSRQSTVSVFAESLNGFGLIDRNEFGELKHAWNCTGSGLLFPPLCLRYTR